MCGAGRVGGDKAAVLYRPWPSSSACSEAAGAAGDQWHAMRRALECLVFRAESSQWEHRYSPGTIVIAWIFPDQIVANIYLFAARLALIRSGEMSRPYSSRMWP
jgi:hypothetical protein